MHWRRVPLREQAGPGQPDLQQVRGVCCPGKGRPCFKPSNCALAQFKPRALTRPERVRRSMYYCAAVGALCVLGGVPLCVLGLTNLRRDLCQRSCGAWTLAGFVVFRARVAMYQCRLVRCTAPCPGVQGAACARGELTLVPPRSTCPTSSSSRRRSASTACTSSGAAARPLREPERPAAPRSACSQPLGRRERARAGAPARRARAAAGPARAPGRGWCRCSACLTRSWCTRRAWTHSSSTARAPLASSSSCPSPSWHRPCVRAPPLFALQPHGPPRMHAPAQLTVGSSVRPTRGRQSFHCTRPEAAVRSGSPPACRSSPWRTCRRAPRSTGAPPGATRASAEPGTPSCRTLPKPRALGGLHSCCALPELRVTGGRHLPAPPVSGSTRAAPAARAAPRPASPVPVPARRIPWAFVYLVLAYGCWLLLCFYQARRTLRFLPGRPPAPARCERGAPDAP